MGGERLSFNSQNFGVDSSRRNIFAQLPISTKRDIFQGSGFNWKDTTKDARVLCLAGENTRISLEINNFV